MKKTVIKIGKPAHLEYQKLVDKFLQRFARSDLLELIVVPAHKGESTVDRKVEKLLDQYTHRHVVGLDERGAQWSSTDLAGFLQKSQDDGGLKNLVFVIGGPYGLSDCLRQKCDRFWALSQGVFTSDLAMLVAIEQLYRATSINTGSPYHHA